MMKLAMSDRDIWPNYAPRILGENAAVSSHSLR